MTLPMQRLADIAVQSLDEELRRESVVYMDPRVHAAGSAIAVGRLQIAVRAPSVLAFIDLAPGANWGHACRYLLIDVETGTVESQTAQFPPPKDQLRLLHRGERVEDWMLLTKDALN